MLCAQCEGKCCRDDLGYKCCHMGAESYYHSCDHCDNGEELPPSFFRRAWVLTDEQGHFFNPRNGATSELINIPSHIYWDKEKAEEVAKGYGKKVVPVRVTVTVGV